MRLGLLGPADGDLDALARAAEFLLNREGMARVLYLGADAALEQVVELWAESIVGPEPYDSTLWDRVFDVIAHGSCEQVDAALKAERARLRLKALEALPAETLRTVEMIGDRVTLVIYDKALLDEEDIYSAKLLVYGKSDGPLVKRIGARWFLTPGPVGGSAGGVIVLDDATEELTATLYDANGNVHGKESLSGARGGKVRVLGEP